MMASSASSSSTSTKCVGEFMFMIKFFAVCHGGRVVIHTSSGADDRRLGSVIDRVLDFGPLSACLESKDTGEGDAADEILRGDFERCLFEFEWEFTRVEYSW